MTTSFINTINPVTGTRPFPQFGQVEFRGNQNNSSFQGMQISLQRSFKHGLLASFNYLWSHEIDDGSLGGGEADFPQNPECRACQRASGDFDVRHVWNSNFVYQLPLGAGQKFLNQPGFLRGVLGSWELTAIVVGRTGLPVNVTLARPASAVPDGNTQNQRPDLVPGVSLEPLAGGSPAQWINPAAFSIPAPGTFGNAPRNVVRGPGTWQADFGITRRITLSDRFHLDFRAEAFNILNRPQYGTPQADFSAGNSFGSILSIVNTGPVGTGTPRQLQFMVRLGF